MSERREPQGGERKPATIKVVASNRRARHEYHVLETVEAGVVLFGHEVKSIREARVTLADAYASVRNGEAFIDNLHITAYSHGDVRVIDPLRTRKLLLKGREVAHLFEKIREKGLTLIPLSIYFKGHLVKVELGLCKGKKLYDKRADIADRDAKRDLDRVTRGRGKFTL